MEEITRFDMDMDGSMEPSEHGQWVRYEDVPQRTWVGLELEDQKVIADSASSNNWNDWQMMDAIENKLKEKNGIKE